MNEKIPNDNVFNYYLKSLVETFSNDLQIRIYTELALQKESEDNEYLERLRNIPNGEDYFKSAKNIKMLVSSLDNHETTNGFVDYAELLI
jgi:O6-methylguanine-DNA--protein-cysteine methyltransferase